MIPFISTLAGDGSIRLIVAGLALAGAAIGGAALMADHKNAQIADINAQQAAENARTAQAVLGRMQAAQKTNVTLEARIVSSEAALQTQTEEKNDAIRRLTTGRPCLTSAAVRVLNQPAGGQLGTVPAARAESVPADATFATDADVGLWANACRRGYDTCRGRLQAIADFYTEPTNQDAARE